MALLTVNEVAELTGLSVRTVRNYCHKPYFLFKKVVVIYYRGFRQRHEIKIYSDSVDEFIKENPLPRKERG